MRVRVRVRVRVRGTGTGTGRGRGRGRVLALDLLVAHGGGTPLAHAPCGHLHRGSQLGVAPRGGVVRRDGGGDIRLDPVVLDRPPRSYVACSM